MDWQLATNSMSTVRDGIVLQIFTIAQTDITPHSNSTVCRDSSRRASFCYTVPLLGVSSLVFVLTVGAAKFENGI
jgi:hypothetical protein